MVYFEKNNNFKLLYLIDNDGNKIQAYNYKTYKSELILRHNDGSVVYSNEKVCNLNRGFYIINKDKSITPVHKHYRPVIHNRPLPEKRFHDKISSDQDVTSPNREAKRQKIDTNKNYSQPPHEIFGLTNVYANAGNSHPFHAAIVELENTGVTPRQRTIKSGQAPQKSIYVSQTLFCGELARAKFTVQTISSEQELGQATLPVKNQKL